MQRQRLKAAVREVALRSNIRPPGPLVMQAIMAERDHGKLHSDRIHGLRYSAVNMLNEIYVHVLSAPFMFFCMPRFSQY